MALILMVLIAIAVVAINDISSRASMRLAYIHSLESVGNFMTHVGGDLALLRRAANSTAVQEWFANEHNYEKRQNAFYEIFDSARDLQSQELYFGIVSTGNEYSFDLSMRLEHFLPYGRMIEGEPMDAWFFDLLHSDRDFLFNIDVDKVSHRWTVWINHKVFHEGQVVGVLCAPFRIDDILNSMFGQYSEGYIRGYVIDNNGYIHIGSTTLRHFSYVEDELVHIGYIAPELDEFVNNFVNSNSRFFTEDSLPEVIQIRGGAYSYASVAPIVNSDWMVIALFNSDALFSVETIVPLAATLISSLIIYMLINITVTRHYVLKPLIGLTESVSQIADDDIEYVPIYGTNRDDEIGDLSLTIQLMLYKINAVREVERQVREALEYREQLLNTVNQAAEILLTAPENDTMQALLSGMKIVGNSLDVDRILIWYCEKVNGELYFVLKYAWLSDIGAQKKAIPIGFSYAYSTAPEWFDIILQGKRVCGPVSSLPSSVKSSLRDNDIVSVVALPLFLNGKQTGFVSIQDCENERTFTKDEMDIMASAGLMFASVFNQNMQRDLANTDALTGIHNRRYLMWMADQQLQNCTNNNTDFSLIMLDIDFFKSINDGYGHSVGDEVLKILTARVRHVLKEDTLFARYGGEEFVVTLSGVNCTNTIKTAWRIQKNIEATAFRVGELEIKVTASFGTASKTVDCTTLLEILSRADKALYKAKENGRNTVVGFSDIEI